MLSQVPWVSTNFVSLIPFRVYIDFFNGQGGVVCAFLFSVFTSAACFTGCLGTLNKSSH